MPGWSLEAFFRKLGFPLSSPDRVTSARYGGNYPASTGGRKAAREDDIWLFTRTPVEWGTFGRRKGYDAFATGFSVWFLRGLLR